MNDALELLRSAEINFENFAKMVPAVAAHPIFAIAKQQLAAGIAEAEKSE